jgi:capsular exopolysaccharide synthesis family protein
MSRIHDALRKAQKERENNLQKAAEIVSSIAAMDAVDSSELKLSPIQERLSEAVSQGSATEEEFIRFEQLRQQCAKRVWKTDPAVSAFAIENDPHSGAEQFRTLRSRLYRLRENQPLKTLLVTSAMATDGKTYVASNLAQAIARQIDRRVLMIDADLRNPNLHLPVGAPKEPGLSEYLSGKATEFEVIQFGGNGNLCLIPGGAHVPDPAELLAGDRFGRLIERMAPIFEWIIVDSPPTLPVSDASILAGGCDGVLIVVGAGRTSVEAAQRACQEMRARNLLGIVLNRADHDSVYGSQYPYGGSKEMPA